MFCFWGGVFFFVCFFLFFLHFSATHVAYGRSQARCHIWAAVAGLRHSHTNTRTELHLWPIPQLTAKSSSPMREARGWTHILMDTSQVCYHWATRGTLKCNLCNSNNIYYFHKDIITLKKSNTNQNLFFLHLTWERNYNSYNWYVNVNTTLCCKIWLNFCAKYIMFWFVLTFKT